MRLPPTRPGGLQEPGHRFRTAGRESDSCPVRSTRRSPSCDPFPTRECALLRTESELNQASLIKPPIRNASRRRGVDDRLCTGAEADVLSQFFEFFDRARDVELLAMSRRQDQIASHFDGLAADVFFDVLDRDFVDAVLIALTSTTEADDMSG